MPRRRDCRPAKRGSSRLPHLGVESLEGRIVLAAAIGWDRASRTVSIVGSEGNDSAQIRQQGANLVVSLNSAAGRLSRTVPAAQVSRMVFTGLAGNDTFTNQTAIPSRANGGAGDDVLRGGRGVDQLIGGDGSDQLYGGAGTDSLRGGLGNDELHGGAGNDALHGEKGNDWFDGAAGRDTLVGGDGMDLEVDTADRFADGDTDGDGYDNDYDSMDILYEAPSNPPAYADDASAAPIIAAVDGQVRNFLSISAADSGLRVRVQINDGTVTQPGRFGDRVTGVWRYLTPDKIQLWGKWSYPASAPSQVNLAVQWSYDGPFVTPEQVSSGDIADYSNPANYSISAESRLYAGFLNGPITFIGWLPGTPAGFYFTAPNEQATGFPAPIEALRAALSSLPNFTNNGESFSGDFSTSPGLPGVQPVLDVLRTIDRVTRASRQQLAQRA
jgi:Ca2+-binding RTX toxin-like protein